MFKRNLIANYAGQGYAAFISIAILPLYIQYLGIEAYGLIGVYTVAFALLGFVDSVMQTVVTREMAHVIVETLPHTRSRRVFLRAIEVIVLAVMAVIVAGFWIASDIAAVHWVKAERLPIEMVSVSIAWIGVVVSLRLLEGLYRACLMGLQRHVGYNALHVFNASIRWIGSLVVIAWVCPTVTAFFAWQAAAATIAAGLLRFATYYYLPKDQAAEQFSFSGIRNASRFGSGVLLIAFLALLLTQLDKVLLSEMLTLTEFGYYSLANTVSAGLMLLVFPVADTFYPRMSELHAQNKPSDAAHFFHLGSQIVSVTVGSLAVVMIFFAEPILQLWTHDMALAQRVAPLLQLLVLGYLLNALYWMPYRAQLAHGWTGLAVCINLVAVLVLVPAVMYVVPRWGAIGAAWIWVCLNVGYVFIGSKLMFRKIMIGESNGWYWADNAKPLLHSLICILIFFALFDEQASMLWNAGYIFGSWVIVFCVSALSTSLLSGYVRAYIGGLLPLRNHR